MKDIKDGISLILIFALAILAESECWVVLTIIVALGLLQYEKIEAILTQRKDG